MNKQIIFAILGVILLLLVIGSVSAPRASRESKNVGENTPTKAQDNMDVNATSTLDTFAQCLASKKLTMYGAEWCPHCKKEKNRFGAAFKYVPYVECPNNANLCLLKGIKGYPTWIDASSTLYEGEQGLDGLAKISGCELPVVIN